MASEGTFRAAMYYCMAIEVNTALINSCSSQHPELASSLAAALESWRRRYGERAEAAATGCDKRFREMASAEKVDWETASRKVEAGKSEFIAELRARAASEPAFCEKIAPQLATPSDFEDHLWKQP
jgi:hypothetical protein